MNQPGPKFQLGYRRSLDGLRGVAILLVLLGHGEIIGSGFGFVAVNVFFVLSGFLITALLVAEWDHRGQIHLGDFYLRRALRLLPALFVMLLAFVIFAFAFFPRPQAVGELRDAGFAFFYCTNWAQIVEAEYDRFVGQTWSLSIEEQFYFLWPVLLSFLLPRTSRKSLLCWIFLGSFLSAAWRIGLYFYDADITRHLPRLYLGTDTRADSLLLGCLIGAGTASRLWQFTGRQLKLLNIAAVISLIGLFYLSLCRENLPWMIYAGWFANSTFAAVLILRLVQDKNGWLPRLLENRLLTGIGRISYGLYIWHYPILVTMGRYHFPTEKLLYLLPVFLMVITSYYLVEKPCLRLKQKFAW